MAQIDALLQSLAKFSAQGAILASNEKVQLTFGTAKRYASQTTPHDSLVAMIEEIVPASVTLNRKGETTFKYNFNGVPVTVRVDASPNLWKVKIEPKPAPPEVAPPAEGSSAVKPPASAPKAAAPSAAPAAPRAPGPATVRLPAPAADTSPAPAAARSAAPAADTSPVSAAAPSPAPAAAPSPVPAAALSPVRAATPAPATPAVAALPAPPAARPRPVRPPGTVAGRAGIERLLLKMIEMGASDLHLSAGNPPYVRLHGVIQAIGDLPVMEADDLLAHLYEVTPERNREEFERRNDTDFAHEIPGVSRFRVNLFRDRKGPGAVFRAIPFQILSPEQIGLPKSVLQLCYLTKGLVLVTGPTGSGKSTTLATLIDHINLHRTDHIVTIEDPIEFVHENKKCLIHQREVHAHTESFKDALRAALREDPDIVLVGEMRDLETIAIAVETAETGHLVFGTLHTTTAPSTVDRVIDQFPADRQDQIRTMLATSLKGVIAQTLCKKIGGGRVAAYEILICNSAVANLIREKKTFQIYSIIQTSKGQGMSTLNDSLLALVKNKVIDFREAHMMSTNKSEFESQLVREGIKGSVEGG